MQKTILRLKKLKCKRCGWKWVPRIPDPKTCPNPKCRTPYWNVLRKWNQNSSTTPISATTHDNLEAK